MRQTTRIVLLLVVATSLVHAAAPPPVQPEASPINWNEMSYDPSETPLPVTESREIATRSLLLAGFGWLGARALRSRRTPDLVAVESLD